MCRFKQPYKEIASYNYMFQYILCVGSSNRMLEKNAKPIMFQYILCVGSSLNLDKDVDYVSVSIHPMCRFKRGERR